MRYIIAAGVVALLLIAYRWYRSRQLRSHVWTIGYRHPLPVDVPHKFNFRVSFPTQAQAEQCCSLVHIPDLVCRVELTPNGQRWAAIWETTMLALPQSYNAIIAAVTSASDQSGESGVTVLATASLPGSGSGFMLHAG